MLTRCLPIADPLHLCRTIQPDRRTVAAAMTKSPARMPAKAITIPNPERPGISHLPTTQGTSSAVIDRPAEARSSRIVVNESIHGLPTPNTSSTSKRPGDLGVPSPTPR
jgi:hypothetical protein